MNNEEIKKAILTMYELAKDKDVYYYEQIQVLIDYIAELEAEIQEANDNAEWWHNRYNAVVKMSNLE